MLLVLAAAACHRNAVVLPTGVPYYQGKVMGSSFMVTSRALSHLTRITVVGTTHDAPGAPLAYFRIDTTTRFVVNGSRGLRWETAGVPGLMFARVRVWLRNDSPTSLTEKELWADARLVVVDSVGAPAGSQ
jgi:hypothetical protein